MTKLEKATRQERNEVMKSTQVDIEKMERIVHVLEDSWVAVEQIADLIEYFGGKLDGMRVPDVWDARHSFDAALSAFALISRDARGVTEALRKTHEMAAFAFTSE